MDKKISKALVGKTITKVEYLSKKEMDDWMWYKTPIAIQLDNKVWLIPMADDEGNDGKSSSSKSSNYCEGYIPNWPMGLYDIVQNQYGISSMFGNL